VTTVLTCPNCGNLWDYSGDSARATCPACKGKVRVSDYQVENIYDAISQLVERMDRQEQKLKARRETYAQMRNMVANFDERVDELEQRVDEVEDDLVIEEDEFWSDPSGIIDGFEDEIKSAEQIEREIRQEKFEELVDQKEDD
jgi:chromosome segregation ATPase